MILIYELENKICRLLYKFHVLFVDLNLCKPLQKCEKKRLFTKTNTEVYIRVHSCFILHTSIFSIV